MILFHCPYVACGWVGVQIFFVLSGFLITSILVADADLPLSHYLGRFYWRRSLRIFPLYFGYLAAIALGYKLTGQPELFGRFWPSLLTYTFNFDRLRTIDVNNYHFGHLWSLAIEEQFYLVWPAVIYLLSNRARRALVLALLAVCPLVRALTAHIAAGVSENPQYIGQCVYSFTLCQLDAFAAGAALALFKDRIPLRPLTWLGWLTMATVVAGQAGQYAAQGTLALNTSLGYHANMTGAGRHVWGYTMIDLWAAALLLAALHDNWVSRLLSLRAPRYLGRISYGLYVFHLIVQNTVQDVAGRRHGWENLAMRTISFSLAVAIAHYSFESYEAFFRKKKDLLFPRTGHTK